VSYPCTFASDEQQLRDDILVIFVAVLQYILSQVDPIHNHLPRNKKKVYNKALKLYQKAVFTKVIEQKLDKNNIRGRVFFSNKETNS
jgi:hypothetical protein